MVPHFQAEPKCLSLGLGPSHSMTELLPVSQCVSPSLLPHQAWSPTLGGHWALAPTQSVGTPSPGLLSGGFHPEVFAYGRPELLSPRDEVLLQAGERRE